MQYIHELQKYSGYHRLENWTHLAPVVPAHWMKNFQSDDYHLQVQRRSHAFLRWSLLMAETNEYNGWHLLKWPRSSWRLPLAQLLYAQFVDQFQLLQEPICKAPWTGTSAWSPCRRR